MTSQYLQDCHTDHIFPQDLSRLKMNPSKESISVSRGSGFTVQDLISAVQNGESDLETESDSSETDEDEIYEENHQSAICPADDVDIKSEPETYTMPCDGYHCVKEEFINSSTDFTCSDTSNNAIFLQTPLEYFQKFVTVDMIESLAKNTNEYCLQKNGTSINTSPKEIEKMLGMYLKMGLMQMSGVCMYWETDTRYTPVSDVMPRNRFQSLLTSLHFVNNLTVSETEKKDKLWKLRPWLDAFRERCLQVVPQEHNSVGEMVIPYKGRFSKIKQYMHGKSHPWGFKLLVKTGICGILCDFDVCQGSVNEAQANSEPGLSGDVVINNTSKGGVDLLDSFVAKYKFPMKSHRWYIYIFWHTITLAVINAWLLYKRDCKAINTSQREILNRRKFQAQLASALILVQTATNRAELSSGKRNMFTEMGRPGSCSDPQKRPSSGHVCSSAKRSWNHPPVDVRKDMIGHFPEKTNRGRCRHCSTGFTTTLCCKCNVRLCFSGEKNCFKDYHCD